MLMRQHGSQNAYAASASTYASSATSRFEQFTDFAR
jgi:hypothetical protein